MSQIIRDQFVFLNFFELKCTESKNLIKYVRYKFSQKSNWDANLY